MAHLEIDVFIVQMPDDAFQLDVLLQPGLGQLLRLCQFLPQLGNRPIRDAQLVLLLSQLLNICWIAILSHCLQQKNCRSASVPGVHEVLIRKFSRSKFVHLQYAYADRHFCRRVLVNANQQSFYAFLILTSIASASCVCVVEALVACEVGGRPRRVAVGVCLLREVERVA